MGLLDEGNVIEILIAFPRGLLPGSPDEDTLVPLNEERSHLLLEVLDSIFGDTPFTIQCFFLYGRYSGEPRLERRSSPRVSPSSVVMSHQSSTSCSCSNHEVVPS